MKPTVKESILGRKITRAEALEGLGDPATWEAEDKALEHDFHARPINIETRGKTYKLRPRIVHALRDAGISLAQTRSMSDMMLRKVAGIGNSSLNEIRKKVGKQSNLNKWRKSKRR
jgi:DNA-directed RNA polymerase alpha subunit